MNIRRFKLGDEPALFDVYHSAIHMVASQHYTREQVLAWAPEVQTLIDAQPTIGRETGRLNSNHLV